MRNCSKGVTATNDESIREEYVRRNDEIRRAFDADGDGSRVLAERSALVDGMLRRLWDAEVARDPGLAARVTVAAIGGFGRGHLFPYSDVDLLFCVNKGDAPKEAIRHVTQALWDCGLRVSPMTRSMGECERFSADNAELGFSLLDRRFVTGSEEVYEKLDRKAIGKMVAKDSGTLRSELLNLTRERYAKYGDTLFHLEPNVKDCPGGLRDANVCWWLAMLRGDTTVAGNHEAGTALRFLMDARCFLHYRHERDDNVLDWRAQDGAAEARVGLNGVPGVVDAAYWMRAYFRHARVVERCVQREMELAGLRWSAKPARRIKIAEQSGFRLRDGRLEISAAEANGHDPAADPDLVLSMFAAMARTGARLSPASEARVVDAIPVLSADLEEGPALWQRLSAVLTGEFAGVALRSMHALGVLDLILPEFHGIDALVIRDAYHRYTVDEHTFVLVDVLHELETEPGADAPDWRVKLGQMVRELQNPGLLYLAALLHDTGKGRAGDNHAHESATLARAVLKRLEMDPYETGQVLWLVEKHLEMSAALRRDIFDLETVRAFAAQVQTHEALRMLTLFTYADIQAVHPDALTPWKAENLWRLSMAAANQMDRSVDEERVHVRATDDRVGRVLALLPGQDAAGRAFLEGFPERYLGTRTAEQVAQHFRMTTQFDKEDVQIALQHGASMNEITLVTRDRPSLFAAIAGALAAWGMNVVTADAFADAKGVVVDSFRFTDTFRTLELNESERERFVESVRAMVSGRTSVETMLAGRRRGRRRAPRLEVATKIEFDEQASSHSTLMQVIAQDVPGLLRAVSRTLSDMGYNVEVALVDTEGETAIDVFYLTRQGIRLTIEEEDALRDALISAIEENAGV